MFFYSATGIRGGSSIKIGSRSGFTRSIPTTTTTEAPTQAPTSPQPTTTPPPPVPKKLHVGLAVPYKSFAVRDYNRAVTTGISAMTRPSSRGGFRLSSFRTYELQVHMTMKQLTPSPTGNLSFLQFTSFLSIFQLINKISLDLMMN